MERTLSLVEQKLKFDPAEEIERICRFISNEVERRGVRGVVIGLSGGLDSTTCAYLCARCLRMDQIHLLSLPERDSSPGPYSHARMVAQLLDLPLEERNLSEIFDQLGLYRQVSQKVAANRRMLERSIKILGWLSGMPSFYPWAQQYSFNKRRGFLAWLLRHRFWVQAGQTEMFVFGKVRTRMLVLSIRAMQLDCLQICTTDRSEWAVGFYDIHGDGVGDIAPLQHLYKTQVRRVAQALGVPEEILKQPSSGDLAAGLPNESAIGLSYEQLDSILAGLSLELREDEIAAQAGVKPAMVKAVRSACRVADERRRMPLGVGDRL